MTVRAGDRLRLRRADIWAGLSDLHVLVLHVPEGASLPSLEWQALWVAEISPRDGSAGRRHVLLVRSAAIRAELARRAAESLGDPSRV